MNRGRPRISIPKEAIALYQEGVPLTELQRIYGNSEAFWSARLSHITPNHGATRRSICFNGAIKMLKQDTKIYPQKEETWGTCSFCNKNGEITKDPLGSMCDKCWEY